MSSFIPSALIRSLEKLEHFDREAFLSVHESGDQQVSVHMNPDKQLLKDGKWKEQISDPPFDILGKVPWAPDAYYLTARPRFTLDPLFHAGSYYVQEASGMFLAHALHQATDLTQKLKVLDLCAAPGGKSTMIQSMISPGSLIVSNEVIKTRIPVLVQNMTKWGNANSIVSNNDPAHFKQLPGFFDILLVDAPCSGSGLFRKDPEAAKEWSADAVTLCSKRQQRILADAWHCLKEDGWLIYSTCSYSKEENEDILDSIFGEYDCLSIPLHPPGDWNIVETRSDLAGAYGYRFYPDKLSGEGFFLSVIQKKQETGLLRLNKIIRQPLKISKEVRQQLESWLKEGTYALTFAGEAIHALHPGLLGDFEFIKSNLYLKKAGIRVGKPGEKDWIPDHELALAGFLNEEIPFLDADKQNALRFLRGEAFETEINEKGWRVVRYLGQRLGWVKLLDKRINNYYPKSWRIRL